MSSLLRLDQARRLFWGAQELSAVYRDDVQLWPWAPDRLFTGGVTGAWYQISDLSTLFVERTGGGTTPSSVNGVVGTIRDKSGNGFHLAAVSDAARPILRQAGSLYYLEFDGVDDQLRSSVTTALAVPAYVAMTVYRTTPTSRTGAFGLFTSATYYMGLNSVGTGSRLAAGRRNTVDGAHSINSVAPGFPAGEVRVAQAIHTASSLSIETNNDSIASGSFTWNNANGTTPAAMNLGTLEACRFYGGIAVFNKAMSADERNKARTWLGNLGGLTL